MFKSGLFLVIVTLLIAGSAFAQTPQVQCGGSINDDMIKLAQEYRESKAGMVGPCDWGPCDDADLRNSFIPDGQTPIKYIRLHFHILRYDDGTNAHIDEATIIEIVDGMNASFESWRIQFTYDWRYANSSQYWYVNGWTEFAGIKDTFAIDYLTHCNIYIAYFSADGSDYSWAIYIQEQRSDTKQGGIILNRNTFPDFTHFVPSHEMGHALGLFHTFAGVTETTPCTACWESVGASNRDQTGDYCSDTEPAPMTFNCSMPYGTDQCTGRPWVQEFPENYMSYAFTCNHDFTAQQAGRMHCWVEDRIPTWIADASFEAANTFGHVPVTANFSSLTSHDVDSWDWDFGDGGSSQVETPSYTYTSPGIYSVTVEGQAGDETLVDSKEEYVWVHADTIAISDVITKAGNDVIVDIWMRNYVPLQIMKIPVSWDGPLGMTLDSISASGLRTSHLPEIEIDNFQPSERRAWIVLNGLSVDELQPDSGTIVSLYFSIAGGVLPGVNPVTVTPYGSYTLQAMARRGTYEPTVIDGGVTICYYADVNFSGSVDIGDAVYLINYIFKGGNPPMPVESGDTNCDGSVNIGDAVYLINHIFNAGPEPCENCP